MSFFNRKPKVALDEFCHDFYDKNILHAVINGIDAGSLFLDTIRKSVADVDSSFASVNPQLFEAEMIVLRFEVFSLAWLHQLGDKRAAEQSAFTKRYLEEQERPDIWEAMEPYNRAIARSSTHGLTPDTAAADASYLYQ